VFSEVKSDPGRRFRLIAGLAIAAAAVCLDLVHRNDRVGVDFHTYLAAAQVGMQRGWSHVYDQSLVAIQQEQLSHSLVVQPFLSPPTVAFVTAPFVLLPYNVAYAAWAALLLVAYSGALAWSGVSAGWSKWIAVLGALSPWWVMHAVNVGQVVLLEAAGCVVAWRLMRGRRDALAGLVLVVVLFKPNDAILVPFALLFAARFRVFAAWAGAAAGVGLLVLLTVGAGGIGQYFAQLLGPLPHGADYLTLHGALGVTGSTAVVLRILIVAGVLAGAHRMRTSPGVVIPLGLVGSLLISPYLHASDLVMLAAAGFIAWEEKSSLAWRAPIAATWIAASPFLFDLGFGPRLRQWPLFELTLLAGLLAAAWWPSLTARVTSGRRAPA
jgi:hypothetical protein